jgi:hypothetical protein
MGMSRFVVSIESIRFMRASLAQHDERRGGESVDDGGDGEASRLSTVERVQKAGIELRDSALD